MQLHIAFGSILTLIVILLIGLYVIHPSLYAGLKITDWISSIFTMLSFFAAIIAIYYAKNYLGQERHKNASNFAIDILHKDMILLSSLQKQEQLLYIIDNRTQYFIHSTNNQADDFCIKHFASTYLNMVSVIESMDSTTELIGNDIYKARIVGCTFKVENNSITQSFKDYTELKECLKRLWILIGYQLMPYYRFNVNNINPESDINIHFPDERGVEREELFKDIIALTQSSNELVLRIKSQVTELRENVSDLREAFNFK